jgi:sec-independent protein translocase protein TatA
MLGATEWIVILVIVLLLFGARKLPELAQSMGASVNAFKKGMKDGGDDAGKEAPKSNGDSSAKSNGHAH